MSMKENNCYVAIDERDISMKHTHMEIDPMSILGTVAGLIPFPHTITKVQKYVSMCDGETSNWHNRIQSI